MKIEKATKTRERSKPLSCPYLAKLRIPKMQIMKRKMKTMLFKKKRKRAKPDQMQINWPRVVVAAIVVLVILRNSNK